MNPLRRKKKYEVTYDPITGQDRILNLTEEELIHADDGSVDSMEVQRKYFLDCGCNASAAGKCYQCDSLSCQVHYGICCKCQKPICLECSIFVETDDQKIRYCKTCHETISRKQRFARIGRFLLSLLSEEENDE